MSFGVPTRLSMALCVGILALIAVAGYASRTPLVSGARVATKLEHFARLHRLNLQVKTYRPLGLNGVRFEDVELRARRGDYLLDAKFDAVDVRIAIQTLFTRGELRPGEVEIYGGKIQLTRQPGHAPSADKTPSESSNPPTSSQPGPSKPVPSKSPSNPPEVQPLHAIVHDVSVRVDLAPLPAMQRPLLVQRAEFLLASERATPVEFRHAYGQMPDGVPFVIQMIADADADAKGDKQAKSKNTQAKKTRPKTYLIKPREPTRVDRWFKGALPLAVSTESLTVCPQCAPATVGMRSVELVGGRKIRAYSDSMSLSAGEKEVRLSLARVSAVVAEGAQKEARAFPYQLADFELLYDAGAKTSIVQGEVEDGESGVASFGANWSATWGVLTGHILLTDFHSAAFWDTLGFGSQIQRGVHSGEVEMSYEPALDLLEFSLDVDSRNLVVALPLVSNRSLKFGQLGLQLDALFQPMARTLSVSRGEATLDGAGPVRLDGYAVDAGEGLVFDISLNAEHLHPQRLRDGLPTSLAKLARGSRFDGEFGFRIDTSGHTRFPDDIKLSVEFDGEVDVLGDSRRADVWALAGTGPPSLDLPGTLVSTVELTDWVDYEQLPARVPLVLAAAEDAKFFVHDGFDWGGVRRALAFNIEEGKLKRGGSTLSQQLSKNLFLDRDRTLARKLQEAYVTWRLEDELSKQRIMELYVNMVEWGPGFQGIRAAARRYFDVSAESLNISQTALLGAILPGPSLYGRQVLDGYLASSRLEKIEHILSNLRFMKIITPLEYTQIYTRAKLGWIGDLKLTICADDSNAPDGAKACR